MAPEGQAAEEGLPEPKLERVQLPTVSNPRGACSLRAGPTAGEGGTPGGEETSGAAPRDGRQGADVGDPGGHK